MQKVRQTHGLEFFQKGRKKNGYIHGHKKSETPFFKMGCTRRTKFILKYEILSLESDT